MVKFYVATAKRYVFIMIYVSDEKIFELSNNFKAFLPHRDSLDCLNFARAILNEAADSKEHVNIMTVCAYESGMASGLMSAQFLCEKIVDEYQIEYMRQSGQDCIDAIRKELDSSPHN